MFAHSCITKVSFANCDHTYRSNLTLDISFAVFSFSCHRASSSKYNCRSHHHSFPLAISPIHPTSDHPSRIHSTHLIHHIHPIPACDTSSCYPNSDRYCWDLCFHTSSPMGVNSSTDTMVQCPYQMGPLPGIRFSIWGPLTGRLSTDVQSPSP